MSDRVEIQIPRPVVNEGHTFTATAYFRTGTAASTPTTIHYRVDCLTTRSVVTEWTSVGSPSTSNGIALSSAIIDGSNDYETKQIVVKADDGLSTQVIGAALWKVRNLQGLA